MRTSYWVAPLGNVTTFTQVGIRTMKVTVDLITNVKCHFIHIGFEAEGAGQKKNPFRR